MQWLVNQHPQLSQTIPVKQYKKLAVQRFINENVLLFLLQYIGLSFNNLSVSFLPMNFAMGTACAFVFLRGYSVLPGIILGSFIAYFIAKIGFSLAVVASSVMAIQVSIILWCCHKFISPSLIIYKLKNFFKFLILVFVTTFLASVFLMLVVNFSFPSKENIILWLSNWLSNVLAILIFSTGIVTWDTYFPRSYSLKTLLSTKLILFYSLLIMTNVTLFFCSTILSLIGIAFVNLLLVLTISSNYGWRGTISATFLSAIIYNFLLFLDLFSLGSTALVFVQILLLIETIYGLAYAIKKDKF